MNFKLTKTLATVLLCGIMTMIAAQNNATLKEKMSAVEKNRSLVFLDAGPATFSIADLEKMAAFNFEAYRKKNERVKIQLERGPLVELLSEYELRKSAEESKLKEHSKNKIAEQNQTHELIVLLNIGLGYRYKKRESEVIN